MKRASKWKALGVVSCVLVLGGCDFFLSAEQRIERAEVHRSAGRDRAAAIELMNALRSDPGNARAKIMLADTSLRLGDVQTAKREIAALQGLANEEDLTELRIRASLAEGEYARALELLDATPPLLSEPRSSTYRGFALLRLGRHEAAEGAFTHALATDDQWHRARIGLAESFAAQQRSDMAISELQKVLDSDPTNAEAWALRGRVLGLQGELADAVKALEEARKHAAGQLDAFARNLLLAQLVEAQLGAGNLDAARALHAELADVLPESAPTHLLAARIALVDKDYSRAAAEARKASKAAPQSTEARLLLGAALFAAGNLNQAEVALTDLTRAAPDNVAARRLLAQVYLRLDRADRAGEVLEPIRASGEESANLDALLGWAKLHAGDEASGLALLERSAAAQPENENLKLDLARGYIKSGAPDKAVELLHSMSDRSNDDRREVLLILASTAAQGRHGGAAQIERAIASRPDSIELLTLAAQYFAEQHEGTRAREYMRRAQAIAPTDTDTLASAARIELSLGDLAQAEAILQKLLALQPMNVGARAMQAEIAFRRGRAEQAIDLLEGIRKRDSSAVQPRLALAAAYLQQGERADADRVLAEIDSVAPHQAAANAAVGRVLLATGHFDEALVRFRRAVQLDESNGELWMNIAQAQLALGDSLAARESMLRATELHKNWSAPVIALARLDLREGDREAARKRIAALKDHYPRDASVEVLEGDIALSLRAYEDAARAYRDAFELRPSADIALREYRARSLGKVEDPSAPLRGWLKRESNNATVRFALAEALTNEGATSAAIEQYEYLVQVAAPSAMVLNNLAWLYLQTNHDSAEETAKQAYDLAPNMPAVADTYGWVLVQRGNPAAGAPILKRATEMSSAAPDIRYHYAFALSELGRRDEARAELEPLLETGRPFPEIDAARRLMAKLER